MLFCDTCVYDNSYSMNSWTLICAGVIFTLLGCTLCTVNDVSVLWNRGPKASRNFGVCTLKTSAVTLTRQ